MTAAQKYVIERPKKKNPAPKKTASHGTANTVGPMIGGPECVAIAIEAHALTAQVVEVVPVQNVAAAHSHQTQARCSTSSTKTRTANSPKMSSWSSPKQFAIT